MKLKKSLISLVVAMFVLLAAFLGCEGFTFTLEKDGENDQITASTSIDTSKVNDQSSDVIKNSEKMEKRGVNADKRE